MPGATTRYSVSAEHSMPSTRYFFDDWVSFIYAILVQSFCAAKRRGNRARLADSRDQIWLSSLPPYPRSVYTVHHTDTRRSRSKATLIWCWVWRPSAISRCGGRKKADEQDRIGSHSAKRQSRYANHYSALPLDDNLGFSSRYPDTVGSKQTRPWNCSIP